MKFRNRQISVSNLLYGLRKGTVKIVGDKSLSHKENTQVVEGILSNIPLIIFGVDDNGILTFKEDGEKVQALVEFVCNQCKLDGIFRDELEGLDFMNLSSTDYNDFMNANIIVVYPEENNPEELSSIKEKYFN